MVDGLFV